MLVLYSQSLLHWLFHWKSFTITYRSAKTAKLFHREQFYYGMYNLTILDLKIISQNAAKNRLNIYCYSLPIQTFRSDFYDWCIPLFDSGPGSFNNYTCSFLATENSMYFINHTAATWDNYDCCLFENVRKVY